MWMPPAEPLLDCSRAAALLMKLQALFRLQPTPPSFGIVTLDLAQHLQYIATLIGKVRRYFHELSSSMR
jgi:hypothetical protein